MTAHESMLCVTHINYYLSTLSKTLQTVVTDSAINYAMETYGTNSKCFDHATQWTVQFCSKIYPLEHWGSGCYQVVTLNTLFTDVTTYELRGTVSYSKIGDENLYSCAMIGSGIEPFVTNCMSAFVYRRRAVPDVNSNFG